MRAALAFLAAPLLLAAAADPHPRALVGRYDGGQMEMAAGLELKADGHFDYGLSYGALDEEAHGTWEAKEDGRVVELTSVPQVRPPRFVLVDDKPDIMGGIFVTLTDPRVLQGAEPRVILFYGREDRPIEAEVGEDGRVALPDTRRPSALLPEYPVYDVAFEPVPLTGKSGHRLTFRFDQNDMGKADFRHTPLRVEDGALVLPRFDRTLRFRRGK